MTRKTIRLTTKDKVVSFIAGMLFMTVFGIIDNGFLAIGMDINPFLKPEDNPLLSSMIGNTFSDIIGAFAGIFVALLFEKCFSVKPSTHLMVEVVGVTVGCIIPILIYYFLF